MSLRLDSALSDEELRALDAHLAGCAECSAGWARMQRACAPFAALTFAEPPAQFATRVLQRVQRRSRGLSLARAGLSVLLVALMLSTLFIGPLRALFSVGETVTSDPTLISTLVGAVVGVAGVLGTVLGALQVVLRAIFASPTWLVLAGYLAICAVVAVTWSRLALQRPQTDR